MATSPVCSELRDRAARAGFEAYWQQRDWDTQPEVIRDKARRVVDAVAEVLAEHHLTAGDEVTICEVTIRRQAWVKRLGNAAGRLVIVPEDQDDLITERDEALGLLEQLVFMSRSIPDIPGVVTALGRARALVERAGSAGAHPAGTGKENRDG